MELCVSAKRQQKGKHRSKKKLRLHKKQGKQTFDEKAVASLLHWGTGKGRERTGDERDSSDNHSEGGKDRWKEKVEKNVRKRGKRQYDFTNYLLRGMMGVGRANARERLFHHDSKKKKRAASKCALGWGEVR